MPKNPFGSPENHFNFDEISPEQTKKLLNKLDTKKATGLDSINPKFLKDAAPIISEPLTSIFNNSMKKGIVPSVWKLAKVSPIYKSNDPHNVSNYRPISVLPVIMKTFERIVYNQVATHLAKHQLLYKYQSGFRTKFSTETALLDVNEYITNAFDTGQMVGAIFLDLKKAFDTVDHKILIHKLGWFGIKNLEQDWFTNYLSLRKQRVCINGILSDELPISCGVPQGSILGPLLFLLYVNDLPALCMNSKVVLYADDTGILYKGKNILEIQQNLENEMKICSNWFYTNKLHLNVSKTKCMLFGTSKRLSVTQNTEKFKIMIGDETVERVKVFKYLGVLMDEHLNWHEHISYISSKISKKLGVMKRVRPYLTLEISKLLYNAIVLPHFTYCDIIWGSCDSGHIEKLQLLQNKGARIILNLGSRSHRSDMRFFLSWLSVNELINYHTCTAVFKCTRGLVPQYLANTFQSVSSRHSHRTRQATQSNLSVPKAKLTQSQHTFTYRGITLWNNLPQHIRTASSIHTFKVSYCGWIKNQAQ